VELLATFMQSNEIDEYVGGGLLGKDDWNSVVE
jgi:hypothetical protein